MKSFIASMKSNILVIFSLLFLLAIGGLCVGSFFHTFSGGVSYDQQDWGNFGSYLSGTVGVLAACLAVIWLMISVHLQKIELSSLKAQLEESEKEQQKQTHISALTAMLNSSAQALALYQSDLIALNDGDAHLDPMDNRTGVHSKIDLHSRMHKELDKINFYKTKMEAYLLEKYPEPEVPSFEPEDDDLPF
ncbi:hypothetical protein KO507_07600 [Gilvimarinus agarilyticus]|uniref:hypothetical protein n=1 Tax=Gilvimarinus sp. 2_MG-2023 TaxID=3062666 RepID=UPI001C0810B5|nr:hypothetical protein [Gilvimarinus sp. 2_MG-2023]MBU2885623.1 hypothetical protein [Gilvimarinus agarilyticus]MDO6570488.1 hypothetical protein [Gilvimarinus sp. 2_MG-2023]